MCSNRKGEKKVCSACFILLFSIFRHCDMLFPSVHLLGNSTGQDNAVLEESDGDHGAVGVGMGAGVAPDATCFGWAMKVNINCWAGSVAHYWSIDRLIVFSHSLTTANKALTTRVKLQVWFTFIPIAWPLRIKSYLQVGQETSHFGKNFWNTYLLPVGIPSVGCSDIFHA